MQAVFFRKGGPLAATTRIMPLHIGKGALKVEQSAISY